MEALSGQPPAISLPTGGGAIRGIGEKFAANPVTGTGAVTVPLAVSPGRSGFGPTLTLSYDSAGGAGVFGLGWGLSLPAIARSTDRGLPLYHDGDESDVFVLTGAEDLVPALTSQAAPEVLASRTVGGTEYEIRRYVPRVEGLFARIERWTNREDGSDCFWRSISQDNVTTWYGRTPESRVVDPSDGTRIFRWLICETYDDQGHVAVYRYAAEDSAGVDIAQSHERNRTNVARGANRHLKRVLYGNHAPHLPRLSDSRPWPVPPGATAADASAFWFFEVVLDYGEHDERAPTPAADRAWAMREDPFSTYRAGFELRTYRRCRRVLMFHHFADEPDVGVDCLVRSTDFGYSTGGPGPVHSVLTRATQCGYRRSGGGYAMRSLPPLELSYSEAAVAEVVREVDAASLENMPEGVDGSRYRWVDLDGEGLSGILSEEAGAWFYKRNVSDGGRAAFAAVERLATIPSATGRQLMDLAGDGRIDLVELGGTTPGFFERTAEGAWDAFAPFASLPAVDWSDPNLRLVDLDGNGLADVLVTEDHALRWYRSLGEAGFGEPQQVVHAADEEQGARLVFDDGTESIYLADMSGDGLSDLVRVRNGSICYWPSLGGARFGAKITMGDSPRFDAPDEFDQSRIRLADIDGTGTVDVVYLGGGGVDLYFNRSGNSWSPARRLRGFPRLDDLAAVTMVDLLGNGTACLVWSSPLPGDAARPLRYVELMGSTKPHLLVGWTNNLGLETELSYAPSTHFYRADAMAGRPWQTRLAFPVHVVVRVAVRDRWLRTRFTSSYSYHHPYFDPIEREFRGFGRVEQVDVESFDEFAAANAASPYVTDDRTLYQPPVKTISWFHSGAALPAAALLSQFADEFAGPAVLGTFVEHSVPEPDLVAEDLTSEEWREAHRACKGMLLRQEVYELDIDALHERGEQIPVRLYSTAGHGCHVRRLQPKADNRHAVFHVTESESVGHRFELDLGDPDAVPDPQITHSLNLATDEYGHIVQAVTAVYGRGGAHEDPALEPAQRELVAAVQGATHLSYTETRHTRDIPEDPSDRDSHRLRVPYDVRTYELTGIGGGAPLSLSGLRRYLLSDELQDPAGGPYLPVAEIGYHELPDRTTAQKRLVHRVRTEFLSDDLQGPLPYGRHGTRGLIHRTETLALSDELLTAVFGARLDDVVDGVATAREKLADETVSGYHAADGEYWIRSGAPEFDPDAADHFFQPVRYVDPFGAVSSVRFDRYDLFVAQSTDPAGNTSSVDSFDFRVLSPRAHRDANDNLQEVAFDALGLVVATAVMGKGTEADSLAGLTAIDPDPAAVAAFCCGPGLNLATARGWLGAATTRFVYHLGEERDSAGDVVGWGARPAASCAIRREIHVIAPGGATSPLQITLECADGSGHAMMSKRRAEPAKLDGPPRWIVAGKTVLNNKGKPVKSFEPYFSDAFGCEEVAEVGVTPLMYYDAVGRLVRTEAADGTITRSHFTPWQVAVHDPNDTVLDDGNAWYERNSAPTAPAEQRRAARLAAGHAGTPSISLLDSLGRDVIAIARNRWVDGAGETHDEPTFSYSRLDTEGKPLWMRDPSGNLAAQFVWPPIPHDQAADPVGGYVPGYDIAGNALYEHAMDAGERWTLADALGRPMVAWTVNERQDDAGTVLDEPRVLFSEYDRAHRPTREWLTIGGGPGRVVELFVYGESAPDAVARNLRGMVYRHYEGSGRLQNERFDFKGNRSEVSRRLTADFRAAIIDWRTSPDAQLEPDTFVQITDHDALSRIARLYSWHRGSDSRVAVYEPHYNERGELEREDVTVRATKTATGHTPSAEHPPQTPVRGIAYNAKGQQEHIRYGNGTVTDYSYDPASARLTQLRTTRPESDDPRVLQDLAYTYDAFGNVCAIRDDAFDPVFFRNQQVEPVSRYVYDGLYRLIEATGRESAVATAPPGPGDASEPAVQFPLTSSTLRNYTERCEYDATGNITRMGHVAAGGSWVRHYAYAPGSDRLTATWEGDDETAATRYAYDRRGNTLNLANVPQASYMRWDYRDMLRAADLGGGGWAYWSYHTGGRRSREVVTASVTGAVRWERIHLDGLEIYRRYSAGAVVEEIESLHLFDGDRRLLLIDDVLQTPNAQLPTGPLLRFQYADQVGSTTLEADAEARIIGYEEFHPHGSTAYRARSDAVEAPARRYRHTGMQRDEQTGLDYHGARYYVPWVGRWLNCDPAGITDGPNRYAYCRGSPICHADPGGTQTAPGPLGGSGTYQNLATMAGWTREHLLPGKQVYWMLVQAFGQSAVDEIEGRLYRNSNATMLTNVAAGPKTHGAAATGNAPAIMGDNALTAVFRNDALTNKTTDTRTWFLQNRRNLVGALLHGGFTPNEGLMARYMKGAIAQTRALLVGEKLLDAAKSGNAIPKRVADRINPATPPNAPQSGGGAVPVMTFSKPAAASAAPPSVASPSAAPAPTSTATAPASAAPEPAPAVAPAPSTPARSPASSAFNWKGVGSGLAAGVAQVGLPMVAGYLAQIPFDSQRAKETASQLASGIASTGIEWVGHVGMPAATTALALTGTAAGTAAGGAFGATTLAGIGTAGAGPVAVAGGAVLFAGAAGYGVGTAINKAIVEPLIDRAAPGSGALGDWWYRHVLK